MVERREWALPQTVVQRFQPNEYVAACYIGKCDTRGWIYADNNGDGVLNAGDSYLYTITGLHDSICWDTDIIITDGQPVPGKNAIAIPYWWDGQTEITDGTPVYYANHHAYSKFEKYEPAGHPNHS